MISTRPKVPATVFTGERPFRGTTPGSLLALHDAGYRAVAARLGTGRVLDVGCGEGFETVRLTGEGRSVLGVDYALDVTRRARTALAGPGAGEEAPAGRVGGPSSSVACMDASGLGLATGSFDAVCSSHLIEHFADPAAHVAEVARVLRTDGQAFFLTPNAPADFENPFHLRLFEREELAVFLGRNFAGVWVGGVDAPASVKSELAARRERARRVLRLDVFDLRHRMPRQWYVGLYTRLLPLAYRLLVRPGAAGATAATADGWLVTDDVDRTTLVLLAVCAGPRREGGSRE